MMMSEGEVLVMGYLLDIFLDGCVISIIRILGFTWWIDV
jgi:hypothetical protein